MNKQLNANSTRLLILCAWLLLALAGEVVGVWLLTTSAPGWLKVADFLLTQGSLLGGCLAAYGLGVERRRRPMTRAELNADLDAWLAEAPPPLPDYRKARGAFHWSPGDEPAEVTMRRIRGGISDDDDTAEVAPRLPREEG